MKLLSVIVPCYNSEKYLSKCVETLLESGEDIEILIIDDGSTDNTSQLADTYADQHVDRIKVIHQKNCGHGGAVNTGIANASGKYIKVVDSDDWVNPIVLKLIVSKIREFVETNQKVDMIISNFVYDNDEVMNKKIMHYNGIIPDNVITTWKHIGKFKAGKYILMHSVIYNMDVIRLSELKLPEHTFYVDNLFVYLPLPYVETLFYIDKCLYHYYIGRDEQSVNEKNMIKRIDQQLLVNRLMFEKIDLKKVKERNKKRYMLQYVNIITTISTILLIKTGTWEAMDKKRELWKYIKKYDVILYYKIRSSLLGSIVNLPGFFGRQVTLFAYKKAQEKIGFN